VLHEIIIKILEFIIGAGLEIVIGYFLFGWLEV